MLGPQHNQVQTRKKENKKRNKCRLWQCDKMRTALQRCALRKFPPRSKHSELPCTKTAPPTRDAMTTPLLPELVLGFPPVHGKGGAEGVHLTPSRKGWRHPQASPHQCRQSRQGFLPTPKNHHPRRSVAPQPTCRQPARATTEKAPSSSSNCGYPREASRFSREDHQGQGKQHRDRAGGNYLHRHGSSRPGAATRAHQTFRSGRAPKGP